MNKHKEAQEDRSKVVDARINEVVEGQKVPHEQLTNFQAFTQYLEKRTKAVEDQVNRNQSEISDNNKKSKAQGEKIQNQRESIDKLKTHKQKREEKNSQINSQLEELRSLKTAQTEATADSQRIIGNLEEEIRVLNEEIKVLIGKSEIWKQQIKLRENRLLEFLRDLVSWKRSGKDQKREQQRFRREMKRLKQPIPKKTRGFKVQRIELKPWRRKLRQLYNIRK